MCIGKYTIHWVFGDYNPYNPVGWTNVPSYEISTNVITKKSLPTSSWNTYLDVLLEDRINGL